MRASTLFTITLAILLGLGVAAGARLLGLFDREKVQPLAAVPPAPEPPKVLVAATNLFEGTTVTARDVMVRPAHPDEIELVSKSKDKLLPTLVTAVNLRVLQRNVMADEPLLKEHFIEPGIPESISTRLEPDTRAVNVAVSKERAVGGLIRTGEYVDVYLTSRIGERGQDGNTLKTSCVARQCKVVTKRDSLYTQLVATPDDVPTQFTLQTNAYRAALLEYVQSIGQLSLRPVPVAKGMTKPADPPKDEDSKEFKDDGDRSAKVIKGEYSLGFADLERVFDLPPLKPKVTPKPITVQVIRGTTVETQTLPPTEEPPAEPVGYTFAAPVSPKADKADKKTAEAPKSNATLPYSETKLLPPAKSGKKSGYVDPKSNNGPAPPAGGEKKL